EPKRAVATLEDCPVALPGRVTDLTALDAAFHALFASEEAGVADMPMKRMLPVRFGRVRVFRRGVRAEYAVARTVRQSLSSIVVNIELIDIEGNTILAAEMVRLVEAPVAMGLDIATLAYRTDSWQLRRPQKATSVALQSHPETRPSGGGQALSEALLL